MNQKKEMKRISIILICIYINLIQFAFSETLVTGDYSNMSGIQTYFLSSSSIYYFATFTGSSSSITSTLYLFMSESQSDIDSANGVWAGIGFGSSNMLNSDVVMCTYTPTNRFSCYDAWSNSYVNPSTDSSLGGKNDITFSSGTITNVSIGSYKTLITFTFIKDISSLDNYDWSNFASWQTNQGEINGAYGYLNASKTATKHTGVSRRITLVDGSGYTSSITVNLGGDNEPKISDTTTNPIITTSTNVTTTISTTNNITSSSNNSKGLKAFDVVLAVLAILILFI